MASFCGALATLAGCDVSAEPSIDAEPRVLAMNDDSFRIRVVPHFREIPAGVTRGGVRWTNHFVPEVRWFAWDEEAQRPIHALGTTRVDVAAEAELGPRLDEAVGVATVARCPGDEMNVELSIGAFGDPIYFRHVRRPDGGMQFWSIASAHSCDDAASR